VGVARFSIGKKAGVGATSYFFILHGKTSN